MTLAGLPHSTVDATPSPRQSQYVDRAADRPY